MADSLTPEQRRLCMASIRDRDTKPEIIVRKIVHRLGYRYRLHCKNLPGKPDLVFRRYRSVIFVHGCFWHAHRCKRGRSKPHTNTVFWQTKRAGNRERDRRNLRKLRSMGWKVLVVWECQLRKPDRFLQILPRFFSQRR